MLGDVVRRPAQLLLEVLNYLDQQIRSEYSLADGRDTVTEAADDPETTITRAFAIAEHLGLSETDVRDRFSPVGGSPALRGAVRAYCLALVADPAYRGTQVRPNDPRLAPSGEDHA